MLQATSLVESFMKLGVDGKHITTEWSTNLHGPLNATIVNFLSHFSEHTGNLEIHNGDKK